MKNLVDINPSNGEVIETIEISSKDTIHEVIKAAHNSQRDWAETPFEKRAEMLIEGGKSLANRAEELASVVTQEMGKPHKEAYGESFGWANTIEDKMREAKTAIEAVVSRGKESETTVLRDPHGVVAAITPWNFPVGMPIELIVPALAVGNTVVFKPSELVPKVGAIIHECFSKHLKTNTFNILQGAGDVGAEILTGDIDFVSFIGSRDTGKKIIALAEARIMPLLLELGGKDPMVVFEDADLEAAAKVCVRESFRNAGQICNSIERVYVAKKIADRFEALITSLAEKWTFGIGEQCETRIGPMVSAVQREKVNRQVVDAVDKGGRLILGGYVPEGPGYFYPPTVLADVPTDAMLMREETFGPVVSLTQFSGDEEEAISLANETEYGLCATIYTADMKRAERVARRIYCGQLGINRYLGDAPGTPWVGRRQSGIGFMCGVDGVRHFTIPKSISIPNQSTRK